MNRTTTLTAAIFTLLSSLSFADHFETLAGYRDAVHVPAGQTALVLYVTDRPTVQYEKTGRKPVQMQLGKTRRTEASRFVRNPAYPARVEDNPSADQPLALAGPATIKLMTDGVVSLRILGADAKK